MPPMISHGVDTLADDASDEETVNPVPCVNDVYGWVDAAARHDGRWCGHAVALELNSRAIPMGLSMCGNQSVSRLRQWRFDSSR